VTGPSTVGAATFRRPTSRVVVDLLGPPIGTVLFLGAAWLLVTGTIRPDGGDPLAAVGAQFVAPIFFGAFGLLMAAGIPSAWRRGLDPTVLRIGPDGMWTPEMGQLGWDEITEVRLESVRGFGGGDHEESGTSVTIGSVTLGGRDSAEIPMAMYGRLGIVPRDPARGQAVRRSLAWRMTSGLLSAARSLRPSARVQDLDELAPFGVYAYDIGGALGPAVAAVERYREVRSPEHDPGPHAS
jgi:hypothetical protein